jgi:broad specificity phosphatase PhoE
VIVVRHGERLDYLCRDKPKSVGLPSVNWAQQCCDDEPYNPPLTMAGIRQAQALGQALHSHIDTYELPTIPNHTIPHIYSSPLLRCVLTSSALVQGFNTTKEAAGAKSKSSASTTTSGEGKRDANDVDANTKTNTNFTAPNNNNKKTTTRIKVEQGLVESSNEDWYRSWCLPNSESSWGFGKNPQTWGAQHISVHNVDLTTIHPKAKVPMVQLFDSVTRIAVAHRQHNAFLQSLLWKEDGQDDFQEWKPEHLAKVAKLYSSSPDDNDNAKINQHTADEHLDVDVDAKSLVPISGDYQWGQFETASDQCDRLEQVAHTVARMYPNETVILVSHGGPVTHLFERLTGRPFHEFGPSKYTCCSIYVHTTTNGSTSEDTNDGNGDIVTWKDVLVNDTSHLEDPNAGAIDYVT